MTTPTVQPVYGAVAALTNAIASLGTSSTFVAGYESATFDNSSTLYDEVFVSGKVTVGTTPTINTSINIYVVAPIDVDGGTWPDVFDGTTSAETITSVGVGQGFLKLLVSLTVDATTSDRAYPYCAPVSPLFGGVVPKKFVLFTTHNTGVNLNSTGGNQVTRTQGINFAMPSV